MNLMFVNDGVISTWKPGFTIYDAKIYLVKEALYYYHRDRGLAARALGVSRRTIFNLVVTDKRLSEFRNWKR